MDAATTILWFGITQIYVNQNLLNAVRTQQNVVESNLIKRVNLWIKPHVGLIEITSHFSSAHFGDKFITFGPDSCIMVLDSIFRMALFYEISC